jgi:hypothetical protein
MSGCLMSKGALPLILIPIAAIATCLTASAANAKFITIPDVLTVTVQGTVADIPYDGLGLFGGLFLPGPSYTQVFTIVDTLPPSANSFALTELTSSDASATTTINGDSYTMYGSATVQDTVSDFLQPSDQRLVYLNGVGLPGYNSTEDYVGRVPSQWAGDSAAQSLFLNNTVIGNASANSSGLVVEYISYLHPDYTDLQFNVESISISYTTTTAFIPEPSTWTTMAIGFAALALAGYRKVKKDSARTGRAPRVTVG